MNGRPAGSVAAAAVLLAALAGCAAASEAAPPRVSTSQAASATTAPFSSAAGVANPTVVTIGDSIMKGNGLSAAQAWPALMGAQDSWRLDNLACNGAGFLAKGNDSDCGETFAGLVAKATKLHPRTIIIEGSSNDFGQSDSDLLPETVSQLAQLRAALPAAQIIGLSTIWGDTTAPAQLADVDSQMRSAVEKVGGHFVELGQPLFGHPEWMQSDDVHPTAAGQLALYGAVQAAFQKAGLRV